MPQPKPRMVFVSIDKKINDLEWKLPVIEEFINSGYQVDVFLFFFSRDENNFLVYVLKQLGATLYFQEDMDNYEVLPASWVKGLRKLGEGSKLGWMFSRLYFSRHKISIALGIPQARAVKWRAFCDAYFAKQDLIFLGHYPGSPQDTFERLIFESARKSKALLVGLPLAAYTHWYQPSMFSYDIVFVSSTLEKEGCKALVTVPVHAVGSPQFARSWLERLNAYYKDWSKKDILLPSGKRSVLIILISERHAHWEGKDHDATLKELFRMMAGEGRVMLIKPHPRGDMQRLKNLLADYPSNSYQIIDGAIAPWAAKVDYVVSLISMGCLFALCFDKVPFLFWPITDNYRAFLDSATSDSKIHYYLKKDANGNYRTHFDGLVTFIDREGMDFKEPSTQETRRALDTFQEIFNPNGATIRVRTLCEQALILKQQGRA